MTGMRDGVVRPAIVFGLLKNDSSDFSVGICHSRGVKRESSVVQVRHWVPAYGCGNDNDIGDITSARVARKRAVTHTKPGRT
jgi:hypothetical protein